jgi:hypothetical protein
MIIIFSICNKFNFKFECDGFELTNNDQFELIYKNGIFHLNFDPFVCSAGESIMLEYGESLNDSRYEIQNLKCWNMIKHINDDFDDILNYKFEDIVIYDDIIEYINEETQIDPNIIKKVLIKNKAELPYEKDYLLESWLNYLSQDEYKNDIKIKSDYVNEPKNIKIDKKDEHLIMETFEDFPHCEKVKIEIELIINYVLRYLTKKVFPKMFKNLKHL